MMETKYKANLEDDDSSAMNFRLLFFMAPEFLGNGAKKTACANSHLLEQAVYMGIRNCHYGCVQTKQSGSFIRIHKREYLLNTRTTRRK